MNYKLVIFDFDGTLADSFPFFLSSLNTLAAAYHFKPIDLSEVDRLRGLDVRQMMKHVGMPVWKIPFVAATFIRMMGSSIDQIRLFDGVPELLKQLSANGVQLAIVSSNSEENIRRVLGAEHASLVAQYECGTSVFGKQRKFRKVVRKSGFRASEILCVGDEIRDLEAARAEALAFGGVLWGYTRSDTLQAQAGIALFQTVADITETVLGQNR